MLLGERLPDLDPDGVVADDEPGWKRTRREVAVVLASEDAKEGPLAFAQKREPVWKAK